MFFWNCEAQSPFDYLLLVTAGSGWIYAAWCLIQLRYERRTPLVWWEPVPFSSTDLTPSGREYHRRFFLSVLVGACAILLAVAFCASR
ncbi:MAG TPA: hypothetical protein VEZ49_06030 [Gemmatimonadales bacterium]|nr:hypothetical protein [Gemmatimonadales bacterium]